MITSVAVIQNVGNCDIYGGHICFSFHCVPFLFLIYNRYYPQRLMYLENLRSSELLVLFIETKSGADFRKFHSLLVHGH